MAAWKRIQKAQFRVMKTQRFVDSGDYTQMETLF